MYSIPHRFVTCGLVHVQHTSLFMFISGSRGYSVVSHMYNIPHGSYSSVALTDTHFASELGSKKGKQLLGRANCFSFFILHHK